MNLAHFQNVLFDMDGVLIDSEPLQVEAERFVCTQFGLMVPHAEWETFKGKTNRTIFQYIVETYGNKSLSVDAMIEMKRDYVKKHIRRMKLIRGSLFILGTLRDSRPRKRIALTTSTGGEIQGMVFEQFHLATYFDLVVNGDMVKNGKPHPEPYLLTAERLHAKPKDCVVIEDSDNGIRSAKAAGCTAIGITTSFPRERLLAAGADHVVDSHHELAQLFR